MCFILAFVAAFYLLICKFFDLIKKKFPQFHIDQHNQSYSPKETKEAKKCATFNILLGMLILYFIWQFIHISSKSFGLIEVIKLLFMFFVSDTFFYWSHRILHIPWIFKVAHKLHHSHNAPMTWTSLYVHPIEFTVALFSIFIVPLFLFDMHPLTVCLFLCGVIFSLVFSHSGLKFNSWIDSSHHDLHHQKRRGNYGSDIGVWDFICGTRL